MIKGFNTNYLCLEHIFMVLKVFEPFKVYCISIIMDVLFIFREMKERPKSAPNKSKKESASKSRKTASGQTSKYYERLNFCQSSTISQNICE